MPRLTDLIEILENRMVRRKRRHKAKQSAKKRGKKVFSYSFEKQYHFAKDWGGTNSSDKRKPKQWVQALCGKFFRPADRVTSWPNCPKCSKINYADRDALFAKQETWLHSKQVTEVTEVVHKPALGVLE